MLLLYSMKANSQKLEFVGNGQQEYFNKLAGMLPKSKPQPMGAIIPDLTVQGNFGIVKAGGYWILKQTLRIMEKVRKYEYSRIQA